MKSDSKGCSTCRPGEEMFEFFETQIKFEVATRVQYDYRTPDGRLFSCVAKNLIEARSKRDAWLLEQERWQKEHHQQ